MVRGEHMPHSGTGPEKKYAHLLFHFPCFACWAIFGSLVPVMHKLLPPSPPAPRLHVDNLKSYIKDTCFMFWKHK